MLSCTDFRQSCSRSIPSSPLLLRLVDKQGTSTVAPHFGPEAAPAISVTRSLFDILEPLAAAGAKTRASILDARQETRISLQSIFEPVVLGSESDEYAGRSPMSGIRDKVQAHLLLRLLEQLLRRPAGPAEAMTARRRCAFGASTP